MLNAIHKLYFFHLVNEAIAFQSRFNALFQDHDMDAMKVLLDEVKEMLAEAKKKVNEHEL